MNRVAPDLPADLKLILTPDRRTLLSHTNRA